MNYISENIISENLLILKIILLGLTDVTSNGKRNIITKEKYHAVSTDTVTNM